MFIVPLRIIWCGDNVQAFETVRMKKTDDFTENIIVKPYKFYATIYTTYSRIIVYYEFKDNDKYQ